MYCTFTKKMQTNNNVKKEKKKEIKTSYSQSKPCITKTSKVYKYNTHIQVRIQRDKKPTTT